MAHDMYMQEMRDLHRQNAKQIAALTDLQTQTSSDLQKFVANVMVIQEQQKRQDEAIARLEKHNENQQQDAQRQQQNTFTLRNNLVFWFLSGAGVAIGVVNLLAQHLNWK